MLIYFQEKITLADVAYPKQGIHTGDNNYYLRLWQEVKTEDIMLWQSEEWNMRFSWAKLNKGGYFRKWYGNLEYVIRWKNDGEEVKNSDRSVGAGNKTFSKI